MMGATTGIRFLWIFCVMFIRWNCSTLKRSWWARIRVRVHNVRVMAWWMA